MINRRSVLRGTGALAVCSLAWPSLALADARRVAEEIAKFTGGAVPVDSPLLSLDLPQIAEDGFVVPMTVSVESPMTEQDHVRRITVISESNPLPGVITARFTPASGRASVSTRIRLARSQRLFAVAELSDGRYFSRAVAVTVTVGGCGV